MNYREALDYLKTASLRGSKLGLERVTELMQRLRRPQEQYAVIHLAGTNGKGSVGVMLSSVLTKAGYRVGHFSSPALTNPLDYFRINGETVTETQFAQAITEVAAQAEQMADLPTEFEILAAMAYTLFAQENCELAVIECCMGGDTDCTNVLAKPLLSIITNVQLDHMQFLGSTTAEIAAHKAGIIKANCPVVVNPASTDAQALSVIRQRADDMKAPLTFVTPVEPDSVTFSLDGTQFKWAGEHWRTALPGAYQAENAATVLQTVDVLRRSLSIPDEALREGLGDVHWQGRFEIMHRDPVVIFDGAHNPDGIRQLKTCLDAYFGTQKCAALVGVMADKDYSGYPALFAERFSFVHTVKPDNPRALDAQTLADVFANGGIPAAPFATVDEGTAAAYSYAKSHKMPLIVFGSLYLYREFCEAFRKNL